MNETELKKIGIAMVLGALALIGFLYGPLMPKAAADSTNEATLRVFATNITQAYSRLIDCGIKATIKIYNSCKATGTTETCDQQRNNATSLEKYKAVNRADQMVKLEETVFAQLTGFQARRSSKNDLRSMPIFVEMLGDKSPGLGSDATSTDASACVSEAEEFAKVFNLVQQALLN